MYVCVDVTCVLYTDHIYNTPMRIYTNISNTHTRVTCLCASWSTLGPKRAHRAHSTNPQSCDGSLGSCHLHRQQSAVIHIYISICIRMYMHRYMHIYTLYAHTYIHTYIHTYVRTYIHTYIRTYIHTYIHTYKHTNILTY
jgi:hypothetical protein